MRVNDDVPSHADFSIFLLPRPHNFIPQPLLFACRLDLNSVILLEVPAEFLCFVNIHKLHVFGRLTCLIRCRKMFSIPVLIFCI
jgi:hypothetical protein